MFEVASHVSQARDYMFHSYTLIFPILKVSHIQRRTAAMLYHYSKVVVVYEHVAPNDVRV